MRLVLMYIKSYYLPLFLVFLPLLTNINLGVADFYDNRMSCNICMSKIFHLYT